jgi:hypothetical protein
MLMMQALAAIEENNPEAQTTQALAPTTEYVLAAQETQAVAPVVNCFWGFIKLIM